MHWLLLAAGVGVLALTFARRGSAAPTTSPALPAGPLKVAALGDSITAFGSVQPHSKGYCGRLLQYLPAGSTVTCYGYSGKSVPDIASHLDEALAGNPDVLVVFGGVNDLNNTRSAATVAPRLETLYRAVKARGVRLIAVCVTPWGSYVSGRDMVDQTDTLNDWILSSPLPDAKVDTDSLGDVDGNLLPQYRLNDASPGLHLNAAGQAALGDLIARAFGFGG